MNSKEALQTLKLLMFERGEDVRDINKNLDLLDVIEKDLEVLEIIKTKLVFLLALMSLPYEEYNYTVLNPEQQLTQEEYDKIKEWLRR